MGNGNQETASGNGSGKRQLGNSNRETESSIKGSQSIARASSSVTPGGNGWGRRGEGNSGAEAGWGRGWLGQRLAGAEAGWGRVLVLARLDSGSDMVDTIMTNCFITDYTTRKRPQDP